MNYEEAHNILNSKGIVEVRYQGTPVWLKGLNQNHETAEIKTLNGTYEHLEVPLEELDTTS